MDLVVLEVEQLQEVGISTFHRLVNGFTVPTISQQEFSWFFRVVNPIFSWLPRRFLELSLNSLLRLLSAIHLVEGNDFDAAIKVVSSPTH